MAKLQGPKKGMKTLAAEAWLDEQVANTDQHGFSGYFTLKPNSRITIEDLDQACYQSELLLLVRTVAGQDDRFAFVANYECKDRKAMREWVQWKTSEADLTGRTNPFPLPSDINESDLRRLCEEYECMLLVKRPSDPNESPSYVVITKYRPLQAA